MRPTVLHPTGLRGHRKFSTQESGFSESYNERRADTHTPSPSSLTPLYATESAKTESSACSCGVNPQKTTISTGNQINAPGGHRRSRIRTLSQMRDSKSPCAYRRNQLRTYHDGIGQIMVFRQQSRLWGYHAKLVNTRPGTVLRRRNLATRNTVLRRFAQIWQHETQCCGASLNTWQHETQCRGAVRPSGNTKHSRSGLTSNNPLIINT